MESNTLPLTDLFLGLFPLIGFTSDSQKNKNNTFFFVFLHLEYYYELPNKGRMLSQIRDVFSQH